MADTSTPNKRHWWLVPLALVMLAALLVADIYLLKPTIEKLSWKLASRNFDGWDITSTSEDNIVLVGSHILHYNGLFWYRAPFPLRLVTGERRGQVYEYENPDEIEWPTFRAYSPYLETVTAYDNTHIYAVGAAGILRYNGLWWSSMPVVEGLVPHPYEIWVQNPDNIYALDIELGVLYWNGRQWNTLSLPVPESFQAYAIGGTEETPVITGLSGTYSYGKADERVQAILIKEGDTWSSIDITSFFEDFEPDDDGSALVPLYVWGQDDGRIIIGIYEPIHITPYIYRLCRYMLCYNEGMWTDIEPPDLALYNSYLATLTHVSSDQEGYLLAYTNYREQMRQVPDLAADSEIYWESTTESIQNNLGAYVFLNNEQMIMYGGEIDPQGLYSHGPCAVYSYELAW